MLIVFNTEMFFFISNTSCSNNEQLEMTSMAITIFIVVVLACNPFGVIVHRTVSRKIGHKRSYLSCIGFTTIITSLMVATMYSPEHANISFLYAVLFGISLGWYYPCSNGKRRQSRTLNTHYIAIFMLITVIDNHVGFFVSLVPEEKVTELWGFNAFCSVVLSWVPPMFFAALNESTGNLVSRIKVRFCLL